MNRSIRGAFMMFEQKNPVLKLALSIYAEEYNRKEFSTNGPDVLTSTWSYSNQMYIFCHISLSMCLTPTT